MLFYFAVLLSAPLHPPPARYWDRFSFTEEIILPEKSHICPRYTLDSSRVGSQNLAKNESICGVCVCGGGCVGVKRHNKINVHEVYRKMVSTPCCKTTASNNS